MALYIPHSIFHLTRLFVCQAGNLPYYVDVRREDNNKKNLNMFKREDVEWVELAQNSLYCKVLGEGCNDSLTFREGRNILKEISC